MGSQREMGMCNDQSTSTGSTGKGGCQMPMQVGEVDGVDDRDDQQKSGKEYIYDIQINNPQILFDCVESFKYKNRRIILMLLVDANGNIDVDEIENRTQMAPRTVRNQLQSLEDLDLVDRTKGHCSTVSFVSKDVESIVHHVIDCWIAQD